MPIMHQFQSGRGDNSDPGAIQPSQWNADHVLTGMLATLDAIAAGPSSFLAFDGNATAVLVPLTTYATANNAVLTGIPLAPTANPGTNNFQIATTGFVATAIANLVSSAPASLDTLNELATALGDDANFSATITAALGVRLRVDATQGLTSGQQAQGRANLGLGTSATINAGTGANQIVQLDGSGKLPAVDGSQLTNLPGAAPLPVGAVLHFPCNTAPTGFLPRNGALVSRTTYAALWAFAQVSGNITASDAAWGPSTAGQFSPGDGSTTFRLPDDRGEFIRGWDNGAGIDPSRSIGTVQADAMQGHIHATANISGNVAVSWNLTGGGGNFFSGPTTYNTGGPISDGTNGTPRIAAETRPRNVAWLGCIKY